MIKRSDFKGKAYDSPIEVVKNTLIDRFLLFGAIFGVLVFISSLFPIEDGDFNFDFYSDIASLSFLFVLYSLRNRINLKFKTGIIIFLVGLMFTTDLIDHSLYSTDKVLLVIIPFLSILVYDLKTTGVIFAIALLVYSFVAYLYLHGILVVPGYHASASTLGDWINHVSTVVLIAVILTIFVYSYNKANEQFIFDLEKTNKEIHKQDQILKQSLLEKNVMIQEIHHRVKNNLAVVSGLLELQARSDNDERIKYVFSKSNNRIMSIAKVHEMLYESSDFSDIPFEKYVQELSNIVVNSINKEDKVINFDFDIQVDSLNINHGVPLGIIFNELITNSIKYGFVDSNDNVISISVLNSIDEIKVVYSDNGIGIPDLETTSGNSLGFTLIHSLMDQIGAKFEYDTIGKFQLTFQFPISNNAGPYQS